MRDPLVDNNTQPNKTPTAIAVAPPGPGRCWWCHAPQGVFLRGAGGTAAPTPRCSSPCCSCCQSKTPACSLRSAAATPRHYCAPATKKYQSKNPSNSTKKKINQKSLRSAEATRRHYCASARKKSMIALRDLKRDFLQSVFFH